MWIGIYYSVKNVTYRTINNGLDLQENINDANAQHFYSTQKAYDKYKTKM